MFNKDNPFNDLPTLPWSYNFDNVEILKSAIKANNALSKLNWLALLLPNAEILMSPLLVKESVESNAIENINTTTQKVLQASALDVTKISWPEKEILHYKKALMLWIEKVKEYWWISTNLLIEIQWILESNKPWIRKLPWTVIANSSWEILYTPPDWEKNISGLLLNLEKFNNEQWDNIDPLIKMPIIHYQFEAIHPFYDWNWRTWRILNIIYLILTNKLDYPILFLSEYINKNKNQYYSLLNSTSRNWDYTKFTLFMLDAIETQSNLTQNKIIRIKDLINSIQQRLSTQNVDYYQITSVLFSSPYISISTFAQKLWTSRQTVSRYVKQFEKINIIKTVKIWKNKLIFIPEFINVLI